MNDTPAIVTPIIDSHIHFWDPDYLRYDWLSSVPSIQRPFLPANLIQQAGGLPLQGVVFVQADAADKQALDEVSWVTELARAEPRIQGIVAHAPLETGDRARSTLDQLAQNPLVKGVRRLIQSESPGFSLKPFFVRGVQLLVEYDLPFDICIQGGAQPEQLNDARQLVTTCPGVRFVLDHLGKPDAKTPRWQPWANQIAALAELPNVWCKISGLATEADHRYWNRVDLRPYIDHVIQHFGPERVMYGGDWPVSLLATSYSRWIETVAWAVTNLSIRDQRRVFADNARTFYRLEH